MWGRLATCGRLSIGLPTSVQMPTRPSTTRPQDAILPHIRHLAELNRRRGSKTRGTGLATSGRGCPPAPHYNRKTPCLLPFCDWLPRKPLRVTSRSSASKCTCNWPPRPRSSAAAPPASARRRIPTSARCAWDCPARCRCSTATAVELAIKGVAGAELPDPPAVALRAQELLLSGPAQGLPDLAVRRAAGRARLRRHRGGRRAASASASPASTWKTTPARASTTASGFRPLLLRGPQPLRHAADRDRQRARHAQLPTKPTPT